MSGIEIHNAIIRNVTISNADHGVLSIFLSLDYGGAGQGFGGYAHYCPNSGFPDTTGKFLWRCLEIADVSEVKQLIGRPIRVKAEHSKVHAIGHWSKDEWFDPSQELTA